MFVLHETVDDATTMSEFSTDAPSTQEETTAVDDEHGGFTGEFTTMDMMTTADTLATVCKYRNTPPTPPRTINSCSSGLVVKLVGRAAGVGRCLGTARENSDDSLGAPDQKSSEKLKKG